MRAAMVCIIGLLGSFGYAGAEPLLEGRVQLDSGQPVPGAQVLLFDLTDLRAASLAATTDGSGRFTLPLATLAGALPDRFELGANYPNPFNPSTVIPYQLPAAMHVRLEVFNSLGQRVATLVDGQRLAGFHTASWDATDASGQAVAAGVYLCRLSGGGLQATRSMLLIDGQAGNAAGGPGGAAPAEGEVGAMAPVYGLTVLVPGLVPYVDPAFRVEAGMAPVDVVVEAPGSSPRAKMASSDRILGDVDNTGQVDFFDALLVALYSLNASVVMPNNGDISLGDVNADGKVDLSDAWVIAAWLNDPSDPALPAGIGEPVGAALASLSPDPSTVTLADDGGWHRFTVQAGEPVSVVANPEGTGRRLEITTRSGRGNFCPAEAEDAVSREDGQTLYLSGCASGQATVDLRRESDGTVLRTYTFEVTGLPADLVVESVSVSESTLTPGQSFTLSATVRNQGTSGAEATTLRWYRSSNRTISTRDAETGTDAVGALAAEGTSAESISLTAPSTEGTWYYGACVESLPSERGGNNCSAGIRVSVQAARPDLIVESPSVSASSLTTGQSFTLGATVRNQGTREAPATTLRWYRSSNATISSRDTQVGIGQVGGLSASGTSSESISLTAPSSEGTYYYGACLESVAGEADARNNCSVGVQVIVEEPDTTPVTIPDANLRAAIAAALGKARGAAITVDDMRRLTSLEAIEKGISDLTGMETATNLTRLVIWGNRIADISPLSGLTNLATLSLSQNNIADLSSLARLTNLTSLSVGEGPFSDLSVLSGLSKLRSLKVFGTGTNDLSPLSALTNLWELVLSHGKISDITALGEMTWLGRLWLWDNSIEDISSLAGLTNLTGLSLGKNNVLDISSLSGLTKLTELYLNDNNITDLLSLSGLIDLSYLSLSTNNIEDISPLSGLTSLTYLDLSGNNIEDISPLSGLTKLQDLDLRGNPYEEFPEGDFDIELVLLDDFTDSQKNVLQYTARRWMAAVTEDLPDYTFAQGWSGTCGSQSFEISAGTRIDDLRIYVKKEQLSVGTLGFGGPLVVREDTHLSVLGCMGVELSHANLLITGLHEIGHVLGVGSLWTELGYFQNPPDGDQHFNGPLAIAAFDAAGGRDYAGAKVPVEGGHWRGSVFGDELMSPTGTGAISAITVQSLADLGYGVDVSQADPYTLPVAGGASAKTAAAKPSIPGVDRAFAGVFTGLAAALPSIPNGVGRQPTRLTGRLAPSQRAGQEPRCGAGLRREPIHVVDPQGGIVRILGN